MPALPVISGARAIRVFERAGWSVNRQKGSHVILVKVGQRLILTVPLHKELDRGLLRHLIRTAGISVEEFCRIESDL